MDINRYTEKAQEAIVAAQQLAEQMNHPQIEPEHVLATLVAQHDGIVPDVLRKMGVDPASVAKGVANRAGEASASVWWRAAEPLSSPGRGREDGGGGSRTPEGRVRQHGAPADRAG